MLYYLRFILFVADQLYFDIKNLWSYFLSDLEIFRHKKNLAKLIARFYY